MTVRMIMILLYGAGGVPGRGESPMTKFCKLNFCASLIGNDTQGVLGTNTVFFTLLKRRCKK